MIPFCAGYVDASLVRNADRDERQPRFAYQVPYGLFGASVFACKQLAERCGKDTLDVIYGGCREEIVFAYARLAAGYAILALDLEALAEVQK